MARFLVDWVWNVHNDLAIVDIHLLTALLRVWEEKLRHLENAHIMVTTVGVSSLDRVHHVDIGSYFFRQLFKLTGVFRVALFSYHFISPTLCLIPIVIDDYMFLISHLLVYPDDLIEVNGTITKHFDQFLAEQHLVPLVLLYLLVVFIIR